MRVKVKVIRHATKKPDGMAAVEAALRVPAAEIAVIGDRVGAFCVLYIRFNFVFVWWGQGC